MFFFVFFFPFHDNRCGAKLSAGDRTNESVDNDQRVFVKATL